MDGRVLPEESRSNPWRSAPAERLISLIGPCSVVFKVGDRKIFSTAAVTPSGYGVEHGLATRVVDSQRTGEFCKAAEKIVR